jgi:hypothetical protein
VLALTCITLPISSHYSRAQQADGPIKHLIVVMFDNVHYEDLVRMPHLIAFLRGGSLFNNDQTVLESHTQPDFTSFISGAYPDKTGIPDNNFYDDGHYIPNWSYWDNAAYVHVDNGQTDINRGHPYMGVPDPWTQYNHRGWDVGSVRAAAMALEDPAEVRQYGVLNRSDTVASHYLRYAIHCATGSTNCRGASKDTPPNTIFGSPNIPWLYNAPLLEGPGTVGPSRYHSLSAMLSLSATYALQAHGVAVTYSHIEATHSGPPNSPESLALISSYDHAFDLFFTKLAAIGITPANTLFALMADESDHWVEGGARELSALQPTAGGISPPGSLVKGDSAPLVYLKSGSDLPNALHALRNVSGWQYIAAHTGMRAIHMAAANNPAVATREPSYVLFGNADTWWTGTDTEGELDPSPKHIAWDHGTISPDINTTWLGLVGPNVRAQETGTFIDHVDAAPTLDLLLGLPIPGYTDGRVLFEAISPSALPSSLTTNAAQVDQVATAYKEINAPLGAFAQSALQWSTQAALDAGTPEGIVEDQRLADLVQRRDALAPELQSVVNGAVEGKPFDPVYTETLLQQVKVLMAAIS